MSPAVSERFFGSRERCLVARVSEAGTPGTGAKTCPAEYAFEI